MSEKEEFHASRLVLLNAWMMICNISGGWVRFSEWVRETNRRLAENSNRQAAAASALVRIASARWKPFALRAACRSLGKALISAALVDL